MFNLQNNNIPNNLTIKVNSFSTINNNYQPKIDFGSNSTASSSSYDWKEKTKEIFDLYDEAWRELASK